MQFRGDFGGPVALDLSSEQDTITLGGTAGTIEVEATAALTDTMKILQGVFDLTVTFPSGLVKRVVQGLDRRDEAASSEEHTSELPSPMRTSYAVSSLTKQTKKSRNQMT